MIPKLLDQVRYKKRTHHFPVVLSKYDFGYRARKSQYL